MQNRYNMTCKSGTSGGIKIRNDVWLEEVDKGERVLGVVGRRGVVAVFRIPIKRRGVGNL